ncbi:MAG: Na(+)/H(+) antiporter subunit B [Thermodesulfobacteriota bacterium]|nr:Na(+)/H(+) antiporter subunit B [Desulfovibrionales bacterium]MDQ7838228.1 Na(+)/H(+) antiporter subunit B [Thermodesulfobacteriota bacterium]
MIITYEDIIIRTLTRVLAPFLQLYALYVIAHGHYSPGGGFQGGVILAASFILMVISFGLDMARRRLSEKVDIIFLCLGLLIYSGTGALCLALGGNFLDYRELTKILPVTIARARALGILFVETGVGFGVMAVMTSLVYDISTGGLPPERR